MTDYRKLLTLTIKDAGGDTSPVSIYFGDFDTGGVEDETSLLDDVAIPVWNAIKPLITGQLDRVQVSIEYPLSAFDNNDLDLLSDVEEKAIFKLQHCDVSIRATRLSLPTINEAIFSSGVAGSTVDMTNSDVQTLITVLTSGDFHLGIDTVDSHGAQICSVPNGHSSWGK